MRIDRSRPPGPMPSYSSAHMLLVLLTIGEAGSVGRHALSGRVGLGEGAVRTVIKWLKAGGYISIDASGCRLTPKGKRAYSELKKLIPEITTLSRTDLTVGKVQAAVLVKRRSGKVRTGIEQRDSAIMNGAAGATTYVVRDSRFEVPGSSRDAEKDFPSKAWAELREGLRPEDRDVVIVCGAAERQVALLDAISAALTLEA